jgi:hypothetical protein
VSYTDSKYKDYIIREYSSDTPGLHFRVIYDATDESFFAGDPQTGRAIDQ